MQYVNVAAITVASGALLEFVLYIRLRNGKNTGFGFGILNLLFGFVTGVGFFVLGILMSGEVYGYALWALLVIGMFLTIYFVPKGNDNVDSNASHFNNKPH